MIRAALIFFVLAFVTTVIEAGDAGGMSKEIGQSFLLVFLALAIVSFSFGMMPMNDNEVK